MIETLARVTAHCWFIQYLKSFAIKPKAWFEVVHSNLFVLAFDVELTFKLRKLVVQCLI